MNNQFDEQTPEAETENKNGSNSTSITHTHRTIWIEPPPEKFRLITHDHVILPKNEP